MEAILSSSILRKKFHKIKKKCLACGKIYIAKSITRKYCYQCSPLD